MMENHHRHGADRPLSLLLWAAGLTGLTFFAELVGGLYSRSLALLSDAGHVFLDLTALLFSLVALMLAERPASDRRTFGLHRVEVLAALANGLLITGLAGWILWESVARLSSPLTPRIAPMVTLGVVGLVVNLGVALRLRGPARNDLNLRSAFLHVLSDAAASVGVVAGGLLIQVTGWPWVDPAVGMAIAVAILANAGVLLKDSFNLLLESVPPHLCLPDVVASIQSVPGVRRVEDVHVWGLCSHLSSLSAHLRVDPGSLGTPDPLLKSVHRILKEKHRIAHATLELRPDDSDVSPPR